MCGEKRKDRLDYYVPQGSPPHVRGKGLVGFELDIRIRITPAYAGKRTRSLLVIRFMRDHPRVCGEKFTLSRPEIGRMGSPPRMRGKEVVMDSGELVGGITPAYAGKRP